MATRPDSPAAGAAALEIIADGVVAVDAEGRVVYVNAALRRMLGADLPLGQPLETTVRLQMDRTVSHIAQAGLPRVGELMNGEAQPMVLISGTRRVPVSVAERPATQRGQSRVLVLHDRSAELQWQRSLAERNREDPLTGLLDRREFDRCLGNLVDDAETADRTHALLYVDLDQFKVVNDSCGHEAGDELLRSVSFYLRQSVQHGDIVGRLGGDEFGILLCQVDAGAAVEVAERVCAAIEGICFAWKSYSFSVGASIGVAMLTGDTRSARLAMRQADSACYSAKQAGRGRVYVYAETDRQIERRTGELEWLSRINHALHEDRLVTAFQLIQPIDGRGGRPMAEILIRILTPDGEQVAPGCFIPAAERYNLMPALDRWVVREVFRLLACNGLLAEHYDRFAINLSGLSIADPQFLDFVLRQFEESGVEPGLICFEVTETAAVSSFSDAVRFMSLLRETGCQFALDDFGSGMSSFGYLRELPADYLKIDGRFIADLALDSFHQAIVRSIAQVAAAAGLKTIAEHVDSQVSLRMLRNLNVDYVQGYLIQRPCSLAELRGGGTAAAGPVLSAAR